MKEALAAEQPNAPRVSLPNSDETMGEEPISPMTATNTPRLLPPRALEHTLMAAPTASQPNPHILPHATIHVPHMVAHLEGMHPPRPASPIGTSASAMEARRLKA